MPLTVCFSSIDKAKALALIVHSADISHPAKTWSLHFRWTEQLIEEFFRQVGSAPSHTNNKQALTDSEIAVICATAGKNRCQNKADLHLLNKQC